MDDTYKIIEQSLKEQYIIVAIQWLKEQCKGLNNIESLIWCIKRSNTEDLFIKEKIRLISYYMKDVHVYTFSFDDFLIGVEIAIEYYIAENLPDNANDLSKCLN